MWLVVSLSEVLRCVLPRRVFTYSTKGYSSFIVFCFALAFWVFNGAVLLTAIIITRKGPVRLYYDLCGHDLKSKIVGICTPKP